MAELRLQLWSSTSEFHKRATTPGSLEWDVCACTCVLENTAQEETLAAGSEKAGEGRLSSHRA